MPPPWWLEAVRQHEAGKPAVLVSLIATQGSAPQTAGARLVVTRDGCIGTIGGGNLEWHAMNEARTMLHSGSRYPASETLALGPALQQCCGGQAQIVYEPLTKALKAQLVELPAEGYLLEQIVGEGHIDRRVLSEKPAGSLNAGSLLTDLADRRQPLALFGAGHVGRAVAKAFAELPFALTWWDSREQIFAEVEHGAIRIVQDTSAQEFIAEFPQNGFFLVMTHSHDLDFEICLSILRRRDAGYLGLIGSATKKQRFLHRFAAAGLSQQDLLCFHSPIGLADIRGRQPAVIAASVAADLLRRTERGW